MAPMKPLFALRPLMAPRPASCQRLFNFSTATRLRVDQPSHSAPNTAPPPPPTANPIPQPVDTASVPPSSTPASKPYTTKQFKAPSRPKKPRDTARPTIQLPPPKYHVGRSASKNLPIYTDYKRGGNLHLTIIRRISGDISALRDELRVYLNKKNEEVKINSLTQQVVIKGHHVPEITQFLVARGM